MQNYYAVERFIEEHNHEARAIAELQALRRRAIAERRAERGSALRNILAGFTRGRRKATLTTERG
jgi:hypothetical protein